MDKQAVFLTACRLGMSEREVENVIQHYEEIGAELEAAEQERKEAAEKEKEMEKKETSSTRRRAG